MPPRISAYGDGGFRFGPERYLGAILILGEDVNPWPVAEFDDLAEASFDLLLGFRPLPEILLIGCGPEIRFLPQDLRALIESHGIGVDAMDTGAACRTFNVLVQEQRSVAAALISV